MAIQKTRLKNEFLKITFFIASLVILLFLLLINIQNSSLNSKKTILSSASINKLKKTSLNNSKSKDYKILLVPANFSDLPHKNAIDLRLKLNSIFFSQANFGILSALSKQSYGKVTISPSFLPYDNFIYNSNLSEVDFCIRHYPNFDQIIKEKVFQKVNFNKYDIVVFIFPKSNICSSIGEMSYVPAMGFRYFFIQTNYEMIFQVFIHEFGHFLGLKDAGGMACNNNKQISKYCTSIKYGDLFDPMGNGVSHFNVMEKVQLNWINSSKVRTINYKKGSGVTLNIASIGRPDLQYPMALKIQQGPEAILKFNSYFIEYRTVLDNISLLPATEETKKIEKYPGLQIRVFAGSGYSIINTHPKSIYGLIDAPLLEGQKFVDDENNIEVELVKANDEKATVRVSFK